MTEDSCEGGQCVETAETTNSPPWGSIKKNKENFPNKSQFIIQRGEKRSDWKLPYKVKSGKIHCGGVAAASQAAGGARQKNPMSLTSTERARLNSARKACGTGEPKTSEEMSINMSMGKLINIEMVEEGEDEGGPFQTHKFELMDNAKTYNGLHFPGDALQHQNEVFQEKAFTVSHGKDHSHKLEDQLGPVIKMELHDEGNDIFRCFITSKFYNETKAQIEARTLMKQGLSNYISGGWSARIVFNEEEGRFEINKPILREVSSTPVPAKTDAKIQDACMALQNQSSTTEITEEGEDNIPMEELYMEPKDENPEPIVEPSGEGEKVEKGVELQPLDATQAAEITERMDAFEAGQNATIKASLLERAVEFELSEDDFKGQSNETIEFALKVADKVRMSTLRKCNPDNPLGGEGDSSSEMTTEEITANYYPDR